MVPGAAVRHRGCLGTAVRGSSPHRGCLGTAVRGSSPHHKDCHSPVFVEFYRLKELQGRFIPGVL
jgi:hypothetical protein